MGWASQNHVRMRASILSSAGKGFRLDIGDYTPSKWRWRGFTMHSPTESRQLGATRCSGVILLVQFVASDFLLHKCSLNDIFP